MLVENSDFYSFCIFYSKFCTFKKLSSKEQNNEEINCVASEIIEFGHASKTRCTKVKNDLHFSNQYINTFNLTCERHLYDVFIFGLNPPPLPQTPLPEPLKSKIYIYIYIHIYIYIYAKLQSYSSSTF